MLFSSITFFVVAIASLALAVDTDVDPGLVANLRTADTNLDKMNLLSKDSDWFFDFCKSDNYNFSPGGVAWANAATFPATVGNGMSMAIINLGPCAMLPPHVHPRAAKYAVAVAGTTQTFMISENGARTVEETLTPMEMTIFQAGSIHWMMNIGCENAQLVTAFNSEDPGTQNIANAFFSFNSNVTETVLGDGVDVDKIAGQIAAVGTGAIDGPEQCRAACAKKGKFIKRNY